MLAIACCFRPVLRNAGLLFMRWTYLAAAGALAAGIVLFHQLPANAGKDAPAAGNWRAEIAMDDGEPEEVSSQSPEALRAKLEPDDPVAVLEAIGYALAEVGDGATYVWRRTDGPLTGNIRMVSTFRGEGGAVCRKFTTTLFIGDAVTPADSTACRDTDGHWVIGG